MPTKVPVSRLILFVAASMLFSAGGALQAAQEDVTADPHAKHRAMMNKKPDGGAGEAFIKLHDGVLITQDGDAVHFVDDVIADRIVVMNFVYTTCTTVCPVLSAIFIQLQQRLDDRLGTDVHMVSVSVDPGRDTPERLKAYADGLKARPGWVWLTGDKSEVDNVLRGLGAYTPDFEDHPSMILVGDGRTGTWKRFFGFPGPDKILAAVEELKTARQVASVQR
ncbi:MAG: SCO family protein [Gammaproteobacteria bacterium]|nr:SCO family protein [Gammaproteobacteria bacterium]MDH3363157.1 SCO family protein [Gammaproteobacteria bacterium]MDH3482221.1 SCO family protein [Gammaproteobacteria bacterium]